MMKRLVIFGSLLGAVGLGLAMASCGDNSVVCGEGTVVDQATNSCIPDGTVTCEQGTVMDANGNCIVDPTVCAMGTVFVEGECVPEDDTLTADFEAAAEPNDGTEEDDGVAGTIILDDGDTVSVHGCITPYRDVDGNGNLDIDFDMWEITVDEPTIVDVTADGVHGLSAGFMWTGRGVETQEIMDAGWLRLGINLSEDTSTRQVYLPRAGTYALMMSDSRSIFLPDGAAGQNDETCYFTSISRLAIPAATPIVADVQVDNVIGGAPLFYSFDAIEGDLVEVQHSIASAAAAPSIVTLNHDDFYKYGEPASMLGGLRNDDTIVFVVEPVYNYAFAPVDFTLRAHRHQTDMLPIDGTTNDATAVADQAPTWFALDEVQFMWVDVGDGEVVHFDMSFSTGGSPGTPYALNLVFLGSDPPVDGDILDPFQWDFITLGLMVDFYFGQLYTTGFEGWVRFPEGGRYYVGFFPPNIDAGTVYTVQSTVTRVVPPNASLNTPVTAAPFSATGAAWRNFAGGTPIWEGIDAADVGVGAGWGELVSLDFFDPDPTLIGVFEEDIPATYFRDLQSDGSDDDAFGRITFGESNDYLIMIRDGAPGSGGDPANVADETSQFDLDIHDRTFTDLGTAVLGTPIDRPTETSSSQFDAPGGALYFVRGTPLQLLTIVATPTGGTDPADIGIDLLNRNEAAVVSVDPLFPGWGVAETLTALVPADGWVAFRVWDWDDATELGFSLTINASDPCAGGNYLTQTPDGVFGGIGDDSTTATQTLPFPLSFYGTTVTDYWVSTNGFISFGPNVNNAFFGNTNLPAAANPNGIIAPYWDDMDGVQICKVETATSVTIRWLFGFRYGFPTQTQDVEMTIHNTNNIDFAYSPGGATSASATIGAENVAGTAATVFGFNVANQDVARTFTTP